MADLILDLVITVLSICIRAAGNGGDGIYLVQQITPKITFQSCVKKAELYLN